MVLGAMNAWIVRLLPADVTNGEELPSMDALGNLIGPISTHVFVIVAVFAVIALITAERESGTLAWTASKPVSRSGIWLSKFVTATGMMWLLAGILPLAATVAVAAILYGSVPASTIAAVVIGMGMVTALYVAVALAASTLVTSQAAVAGITLAVLSVAPMLAAVLPDPLLMPTSILDWAVRLGVGAQAGFLSIVSWAVTLVALIAFSLRRMERMEL
jgi:ABC-type multidrug transport system permease subunit